jgi:23S rRNA pseudouridine955/2504/2580 synthase
MRINHLQLSSAQVKHIIEGKPAQDRSQNTATASVRLIEVDEDSAGQRLDNFLMRHLKGCPRPMSTASSAAVKCGSTRGVSAETRVQPGDVVRLPPVRISDKVAKKRNAQRRLRTFRPVG